MAAGAFSETRKHHQIKFGTDGWRALIAKEFTYDNLNLVVAAVALYIKDKAQEESIESPLAVVGYDARFLADRFAEYAAKILSSFGLRVKIVNSAVPTPVIAHAAKEENSCGALMFTASHNPPEYMGIKYIPEYAGPATVDITNRILEYIDDLAIKIQSAGKIEENSQEVLWGKEEGAIENFDPSPAYFRDIRKIIDFKKLKELNQKKLSETGSAYKVIYDPIYGAGRGFSNKLLEEAGFEVETLHDYRDALFGGGMPEPKEEFLEELKEKVLSENAILGASNDGDADRFAFISSAGNFFPANKIMPIMLKYLIEEKSYSGAIARTVATTHLLDDLADKYGMKKYETAVGFKWLGEIMRKEPTIIAGEQSGGLSILGHIPEKDGILAILLVAEILAERGKTLEELWEEVQAAVSKQYFFDQLDLHMDGKVKDEFVRLFTEEIPSKIPDAEIGGLKVTKVDTTEGAKLYLEDGSWFLARPSGTEAMCRVYFESNSQDSLRNTVESVKGLLND